MFDLIFPNRFFSCHLLDLLSSFEDDMLCECGPHFVDCGCHYELSVQIDNGVQSKDVKVYVDDECGVSVDYAKVSNNSTKAFSLSETIPSDADSSTLKAKFENNVLTISVDKYQDTKNWSREIAID